MASESTPLVRDSGLHVPKQVPLSKLGEYLGFRYFHVRLLCTAPFALVVAGTMQGITPFLLDTIQDEYGADNAWVSCAHTAVLLGSLPGTLFFGAMSDRYGRKFTLIRCVFLMTIGSFLVLLIPSGTIGFMLLVGLRFLLGMPYGGVFHTVSAYALELSADKVRGAVVCMVSLAWPVGSVYAILLVAIIGEEEWRLCLAVAPVLPAIVFLIAAYNLPESPRWLFINGKEKDAQEALDHVFESQPASGEAYVGKAPEVVVEAGGGAEPQRSVAEVLRELYSPALFRITVIAVILAAITSGMSNAEFTWGPRIVKKIAGEEADLGLFAIAMLVFAFGFLVNAGMTDRFGRVPLIRFAYAGNTLAFVGLAMVSSMGAASALWIARSFFEACMYSNGVLWMTEAFPTSIRVLSLALTGLLGRVAAVILPVILGSLFGVVDISIIMLGVAAIYGSAFAISMFIPKETANAPIEDTPQSNLA